jgi:hypothetical protein
MASGSPQGLIPPVLVMVDHQREKAGKLWEYCRELDGTIIIIIEQVGENPPVYPENAFHSGQAQALHQAAEIMGNRPFIWLEPDSIPLKAGWVRALTDEYHRCGKKFMISSDHQRHDLVGGIGVYPAETSWLVPTDYEKSSWDLWLIQCVPHLVYRTPLIQHSYCIYNDAGFCRDTHRFPRDQGMLRKEAVIFHRDPFQDLLTNTTASVMPGS